MCWIIAHISEVTMSNHCPCDLSYEAVYKLNYLDKGYCTAPKADGTPCGMRLADHPRDLPTPQLGN